MTRWKLPGPVLLLDGALDLAPGVAHGVRVAQVELHAADVGLVGDCVEEKFEHHGPAETLCAGNGFVFAPRDHRDRFRREQSIDPERPIYDDTVLLENLRAGLHGFGT